MKKIFNLEKKDSKNFIIIFLFGIIAHMYVATNRLYTADAVHNCTFRNYILYDISLGKWFLPYYCKIMRSYFVLPSVVVIFSLLYISFISVLVIKLFNTKI